MNSFTHYNDNGRPQMVDILTKEQTIRKAIAKAEVLLSIPLYEAIQEQRLKKGDPLQVAQVGGIMGAKNTALMIPMCHPILLEGVNIEFEFHRKDEHYLLIITSTVRTSGKTGVEMEALAAATTAALTFYDMCKALDKGMVIQNILLLSKTGGKSGDYIAKSAI